MKRSHDRTGSGSRFRTSIALAGLLGTVAVASAAMPPVGVTDEAGASQPIDNRQPTLAMTYMVRTFGSVEQVGEVRAFAGNFAPYGYMLANGQTLPVAGNAALFSKLGGTYGGDGVTTFALPDLRDRVAVGTGAANGGAPVTLGQQFGSDSLSLSVANLATHGHTIAAGSGHGAGVALPTGGSLPFDNRQQSLGLDYSIVTNDAAFPPRDGAGDGTTPHPFFGEVRLTASLGPKPTNTADADGSLRAISQNSPLYSVLGTTYGGDGRATFALPDLQGRVATGAALSGSPRSLGTVYGTADVALTANQLPEHIHGLPDGTATDSTGGAQPFDNDQPSLALTYMIATTGIFPFRDVAPTGFSGTVGLNEAPFMGEVGLFAGNYAPEGWIVAEGQVLPVAGNVALYAVIGNAFGGVTNTTFALPDLRGRAIVGAGGARERGSVVGTDEVTRSKTQLPIHKHAYVVPEPATLAMAVLGGALMRRRRRVV